MLAMKGNDMKRWGLVCSVFCMVFLIGCPAMIVDSLKNRRDFQVNNLSFEKENYPTIVVIPYNYSLGRYRDQFDGTHIDIVNDPARKVIVSTCTQELTKCRFSIPDESRVIDFMHHENIDIFALYNALDLAKLESGHTIQKIGRGFDAKAVLAIHVIKWTAGHWYGGNETEVEVIIFDTETEQRIWRGYAKVIHSPSKNYKQKIFQDIFAKLFEEFNPKKTPRKRT